MKPSFACDDHAIESYLRGDDLDPDCKTQTRQLEAHIESCERCRQRLAELTETDAFWRTAIEFLGNVEELPTLTHLDGSTFTEANEPDGARDSLRDIPLQPSDEPTMLGRFGGYEISGVVGRGGMGVVLKGWDRSLDRFVAVKVLSPTYAHHPPARQRFAREAKAAAAVVHDNIVPIYGVDSCNGLPFLVMPYIKGESLQRRIDRAAPLSLEEILQIGLQIARGLQAAHEQGVIHRDIKPANILLPQSVSRVLITDFGLARAANDASLTHSGIIAGTPAYMSPEQAKGSEIDARSDLFSMGSVLYAMATGSPPFRADSPYGIMRQIIDETPASLAQSGHDYPAWFQQTIDRLLAKQAGDRFPSASACAEHLERCLLHVRQPESEAAPWLGPAPIKRSRPRGLVWIALLLIACTLLGVSLIQLVGKPHESAESPSSNPPHPEAFGLLLPDLQQDLDALQSELEQLDKELPE